MQDAGRNQPQHELRAVDVDGVAGVVAALIARDDVEARRQQIDDLALAFVAPLRAEHCEIHNRATDSTPSNARDSTGRVAARCDDHARFRRHDALTRIESREKYFHFRLTTLALLLKVYSFADQQRIAHADASLHAHAPRRSPRSTRRRRASRFCSAAAAAAARRCCSSSASGSAARRAQYIDVERTATTPERFLRARRRGVAVPAPATPRRPAPAPRSTRRWLSSAAPAPADGEPATFLLDEFLELRTFESFPGLRRVLHDFVDGLAASGNRFVLTSRYTARALRLLRDRSARFEVIHMPALTAEDTLDILGLGADGWRRRATTPSTPRAPCRRWPTAARSYVRALADELAPHARHRRPGRRRSDQRAGRAARAGRPPRARSAASATSCGCIAPAATARSRRSSTSSRKRKG